MQLYVDIIKETMQSPNMQEHLIQNVQKLSRYEWADMICSVPIALERKAYLLEELSKCTEEDETKEFYKHAAKRIRDWLGRLELKEGELFCLCGYCNEHGERHQFESAPFCSLEKALQHLQEEESEKDGDSEVDYWYELEKWEPDEEGNLEETVEYMILNGKLCYAWDFDKSVKEYYPVSFSCDLDLPTPFRVGDIVTIDCRPIQPIRRVLIIEVGDHRDCCLPQGLYVGKDKKLDAGAIKHNSIFKDTHWTVSRPEIPALYCAQKYEGVLLEEELILREISCWLQGSEARGRALWEYMREEEDVQKILKFMQKGEIECSH